LAQALARTRHSFCFHRADLGSHGEYERFYG